jgi:hypothetical protein
MFNDVYASSRTSVVRVRLHTLIKSTIGSSKGVGFDMSTDTRSIEQIIRDIKTIESNNRRNYKAVKDMDLKEAVKMIHDKLVEVFAKNNCNAKKLAEILRMLYPDGIPTNEYYVVVATILQACEILSTSQQPLPKGWVKPSKSHTP